MSIEGLMTCIAELQQVMNAIDSAPATTLSDKIIRAYTLQVLSKLQGLYEENPLESHFLIARKQSQGQRKP